jgi:hypothetical protein
MRAPAAALLALAACRTMQADADTAAAADAPAVVVQPSPASRAALASAVSMALKGAALTLADDALTRDGVLIIERSRLRDPRGLPVYGRDYGEPERFHLVKSGDLCVLVHERSGARYELAATTCAPRR